MRPAAAFCGETVSDQPSRHSGRSKAEAGLRAGRDPHRLMACYEQNRSVPFDPRPGRPEPHEDVRRAIMLRKRSATMGISMLGTDVRLSRQTLRVVRPCGEPGRPRHRFHLLADAGSHRCRAAAREWWVRAGTVVAVRYGRSSSPRCHGSTTPRDQRGCAALTPRYRRRPPKGSPPGSGVRSGLIERPGLRPRASRIPCLLPS